MKRFKCDQCDTEYTCTNSLRMHVRNEHNDAKHKMKHYKCDQCDAEYTRTDSLRMHVRGKHEGEKLNCDCCDFQTGIDNGKQKMADHRQLIHGEEKNKCDQCDAEYNRTDTLQKHVRYKHRTMEFKCDQCDLKYKRADALNQHNAAKHKMKRYKCAFECMCVTNMKEKNSIATVVTFKQGLNMENRRWLIIDD